MSTESDNGCQTKAKIHYQAEFTCVFHRGCFIVDLCSSMCVRMWGKTSLAQSKKTKVSWFHSVSILLVYRCPADVFGHILYLKDGILFEDFYHVLHCVWVAIYCVILHVGDRLCLVLSLWWTFNNRMQNQLYTMETVKSHFMMCLGCTVNNSRHHGISDKPKTKDWGCKSRCVGMCTATATCLLGQIMWKRRNSLTFGEKKKHLFDKSSMRRSIPLS